MADFQPFSTATLGMDFLPTTSPGVTLDAPNKVAAMSLLQTAAQVTANEKVYVGAIPTRGGLYVLEVFDNETGVAANLTSIDYAPSADVSSTPAGLYQWRKWTGNSAVSLFQNIDDNPPGLGTADYIYCGGAPTQQDYRGYVASGAALTGKRIVGVEIIVYASNGLSAGAAGVAYLNVLLTIGGVNYGNYPNGGAGVLLSIPWTPYSFAWKYNPATKKPWTIAEIQTFASTNSYLLHGVTYGGYTEVDAVIFRVHYCDENRLAVGVLDDTASLLTANAYNTVAVLTPTGGAWTKDGAGRHLYVARRFSDVGALVIPTLAGTEAPNPARGWGVTLDSTYGTITAMSAASTAAVFGLVQRTSAPADSVDSQPYNAIVEAYVYNGRDAQQEFSNAAATDYKEIKRFAVKPNSATGNLLVKIKKRSDNSQVGGTLTLTPAQVAALPDAGNGWKIIDGQITTATLAAATQYYVQFSDATATDTGAGGLYWSVLTLSVGGAGVGSTAGFGGTTDNATFSGSAPYDTLGYLEYTQADIPVLVSTIPTVPANVAVTQLAQTLTQSTDLGDVAAIQYLHLVWDVTALGVLFAQYDVDRSEDGGVTWTRVALVATESVHAFDDYESLRGVTTYYRVRVVRTDGAASAWSSAVTSTASVTRCEMLFTSNVNKALNVGYNWPDSNDYNFLDSNDVVFQRIYLRDYQVAFTPTERRGVSFSIALVVSAVSTPTLQGVAAFAALRALSVADLPYVCVLDNYGGRFYAELQVPSGNRRGASKFYIAQVIVTEVQGDSAVTEIT